LSRKPCEGGSVDLDPEAGALRDIDPAALLPDRLDQHGHPDRMLGAVEFQERLKRVETRRVVRQGGDQLQ